MDSMLNPRRGVAIGVVNGKIYAIGGYYWDAGSELSMNVNTLIIFKEDLCVSCRV